MKFTAKLFLTIIMIAIAIVFAMQLMSYIWDFPEASAFKGEVIYNPYDGITDEKSFTETFEKSNFHAHTCFDTREKYTTEEFIEAYKQQGYVNIGITDHQYINPAGIKPSYEHGYGLNNFHIGMYNVNEVDWLDNVYMFLPKHQIQSMFNRLSGQSEIIVFNHSDRLRLMSDKGIEYVRGYDLFELYPTAVTEIWDRTLSTGFYIPLVANDDAHSITNRNSQFQRTYTMVYNGDPDAFTALTRGHSYAVIVSNERNLNGHVDMPQIEAIKLKDGIFSIKLDKVADSIRYIGQNGKILQTDTELDSTGYKITEEDPYVRIEVFFNGIEMLTNPIARTQKNGFSLSYPKVNWLLSICNWVFWTILILLDLLLIIKLWGYNKSGNDNYYRHKRSNHYENRVIGAGLKAIDWN